MKARLITTAIFFFVAGVACIVASLLGIQTQLGQLVFPDKAFFMEGLLLFILSTVFFMTSKTLV